MRSPMLDRIEREERKPLQFVLDVIGYLLLVGLLLAALVLS
jgi:hypothetical protein